MKASGDDVTGIKAALARKAPWFPLGTHNVQAGQRFPAYFNIRNQERLWRPGVMAPSFVGGPHVFANLPELHV